MATTKKKTTKARVQKDGTITAAIGSSRMGKTAWAKQRVKYAKRLLIWDSEGEHTDTCMPCYSLKALLARCQKEKGGMRIAYQPRSMKDFDLFCKIALATTKLKACDVLVEELSDVTSPGKAPDGWGRLVRKGAKRGGNIIGITQRPMESDKTIMGNAHEIFCTYLKRPGDREYMAKELQVPAPIRGTKPDVSADDIGALAKLNYYLWTADKPIKKGVITFK